MRLGKNLRTSNFFPNFVPERKDKTIFQNYN